MQDKGTVHVQHLLDVVAGGMGHLPAIMISVQTVLVINVCFFFSYSDGAGFFSSTTPFRTSLRGLPGSDDASVEPELGRRASTPLPRCWNFTDFGFAILLPWSSRPGCEGGRLLRSQARLERVLG
jgi:hypothetical protein